MKALKLLPIAAAITVVCGGAFAQTSATNEQRCANLDAELKATLQKSVADRVPTTAPSQAVEKSVDIKGLLAMDTSAGFSKLISTGFDKLLDSLIKKGLEAATKKANETFNQGISDVLAKSGLNSSQIAKISSAASGKANSLIQTTGKTVADTVKSATSNPYDRP